MRRLTPDRLESDVRPMLVGEAGAAARVLERGVAETSASAVDSTQCQLEQTFEQARQQGLDAARRQNEAEVSKRVQAAETRLRELHQAALEELGQERAQLARMATAIESALARHAQDSETLAVEVAYAALVRVLGDGAADRSLMPNLCRTIVREYGHPPATLRVSDLDLPLLADIDLGIPVEADRRLSPGQAVIDTVRGQFEGGLDVRLAAIAASLATALSEHRGAR
jgi:flagellar biosynthesis/type III secretory pathway protein FliH